MLLAYENHVTRHIHDFPAASNHLVTSVTAWMRLSPGLRILHDAEVSAQDRTGTTSRASALDAERRSICVCRDCTPWTRLLPICPTSLLRMELTKPALCPWAAVNRGSGTRHVCKRHEVSSQRARRFTVVHSGSWARNITDNNTADGIATRIELSLSQSQYSLRPDFT